MFCGRAYARAAEMSRHQKPLVLALANRGVDILALLRRLLVEASTGGILLVMSHLDLAHCSSLPQRIPSIRPGLVAIQTLAECCIVST